MTQERDKGTNNQADWRSDPAKVRRHLQSVKGLVSQGLLDSATYEARRSELLGQHEPQVTERRVSTTTARIETPQAPEAEAEMTKLTVNVPLRELDINGKVVKIKSNLQWTVFEALARKGKEGLSSSEVEIIAKEAGASGKKISAHVIDRLRRAIEKNYKNPKIVSRTGRHKDSRYHLNAEIEFFAESTSPAKVVQGQKPQPATAEKPSQRSVELIEEDEAVRVNGVKVFLAGHQ